ncbi:MAG: creatininase family protein [Opitutaceae bacterium]|jgi:creatinine amidohydrolase
MSLSWLADTDPSCCWAHRAWTEFAEWRRPELTVVVLPVHGLANYGSSSSLDEEETSGAEILSIAARQASRRFPVLVLPPLRHVLASKGEGLFGLDPETALDLAMSIAKGVRDAGFLKLVLFNTSEVNESFISTVAIDARATLGIRPYIINARSLGLKIGDSDRREKQQEMVSGLCGLLEEIRLHKSVPLEAPAASQDAELGVAPTPFPVYRRFYLSAMSKQQILAIPHKESARIVLPTGSIEQHGPHLPVGVDAILGQALLDSALSRMDEGPPVFVLSPITYGKSIEHTGFPGTLSIGAGILRRQLHAIAREVSALGFCHLEVLNTHGGNAAVLDTTLREIREEIDMHASLLRYGFEPELSPQEKTWGMHADEWETSLMLACAPEWVRMDKAVCEYPAKLDDPGLLRPEKAPATFAWLTSDLSKSGVIGDPTGATVEKGRRWLAAAGASIREHLSNA